MFEYSSSTVKMLIVHVQCSWSQCRVYGLRCINVNVV